MSKKYIYILILIALVSVLKYSVNEAEMRGVKEKLNGYIEIVQDFGIQRINFATGHVEEIMKKHGDFFVQSFDLSPTGLERVVVFEESDNTPYRLVIMTNQGSQRTILSKNFGGYPAFSPDGLNIAYLFHPDDQGRKKWFSDLLLYMMDPISKFNKALSTIPCSIGKPSWFPDGKRIAFGSKDLKIYIVDIKGGEAQKVIDFGTCPTVSRNGRQIAFLSNDVDEQMKQKITDFTNITAAEYQDIVKKRDARFKDFTKIERSLIEHSIYIYDLDTRKIKKLSGNIFIEQPVIWSPDDKYLLYNDRGDVANKIFVINVATGETQKVTKETGRIMVWR